MLLKPFRSERLNLNSLNLFYCRADLSLARSSVHLLSVDPFTPLNCLLTALLADVVTLLLCLAMLDTEFILII